MTNKADQWAVHNGEFFGLSEENSSTAKLKVIGIPWDVTTSYRAGTVHGPEIVLEASYQIDLFSPLIADAWKIPLETHKLTKDWKGLSQKLRVQTESYINFLAEGGEVAEAPEFQKLLKEVNAQSEQLNTWLYQETKELLNDGHAVLILGGDHSVPFGSIKAHVEKFPDLSVLHFDAHADLRVAYEGFEDSHASIMYNVIQKTGLKKLVQVGIRDCSQTEVELTKTNPRIKTFFDWDLKDRQARGDAWALTCEEIVSHLSQQVYISFDIDGLDPKLCPNTGTPVPGGLEYWQAQTLMNQILISGRQLVGCDLVEVAPDPHQPELEWDANVGARLLFHLACLIWKSQTELSVAKVSDKDRS